MNQIVNHRGRENAPQHQDNPGGGGGGGGGMPPMNRSGMSITVISIIMYGNASCQKKYVGTNSTELKLNKKNGC